MLPAESKWGIGGGIIWAHAPFSVSDLTLCKEKLGWFSENPSKFTKGFNHLALIYDLTKSNSQIVLSHGCTVNKKWHMIGVVRVYAKESAGSHAQHLIYQPGKMQS